MGKLNASNMNVRSLELSDTGAMVYCSSLDIRYEPKKLGLPKKWAYSGGHLRINKPSVCSKSAIFREAWHIVNLQPCP